MPSADFWVALGTLPVPPVLLGTTTQISRGKLAVFPCTTAGFTLPVVDGYGLRYLRPTRPALAPTLAQLDRFTSAWRPNPRHRPNVPHLPSLGTFPIVPPLGTSGTFSSPEGEGFPPSPMGTVKKSLESDYPRPEDVAFRPIHGFATAISSERNRQSLRDITTAKRRWVSTVH